VANLVKKQDPYRQYGKSADEKDPDEIELCEIVLFNSVDIESA